jgi:hypothetical protein
MKINTFLLIFIPTLFVLSSCSAPPYFITQVDEDYTFVKSQSIFVYIPPESDLNQKKIQSLIKKIFLKNGYSLKESIDSADIAITFFISTDSKDIQNTLILPQTSTTYGNVGGIPYNSSTTTSQQYTYSSTISIERFYIYAFSVEKLKTNYTIPVWQGYAGIDISRMKSDKQYVFNTLINLFGKDYEPGKFVNKNKNVKN